MKVVREYGSGIRVEVDSEKITDVFKALAAADEVFTNLTCAAEIDGKIHTSKAVKFNVRTDDEGNDYYELVCIENGPLKWYKKRFGQHKKGNTLFPKSKPPEGEIAGLNGWSKYERDGVAV